VAENGNLDVLPMYAVKDQKYSVYWQIAERKSQAL
jgi:hypothetical protein